MTQTLPLRSEVAPEHTWDAQSIFPTEEAWENVLREIVEALSSLQRFQGTLGTSPDTLADWLETAQ